MKISIRFVTIMLLISANCHCQWYERRYGVNDIFQLTPEQFKESLSKANAGARTGAVLSIIGTAGTICGISIASSAAHMGSEGEGRAFTGVFLAIGSVPIVLTGLTVLGTYGPRIRRIREILETAEIKTGLLDCSQNDIFKNLNYSSVPAISVTVRF